MRCATCGERLAATDERCPVCGVPVAPRPSAHPLSPHAGMRRCPRCHYTGEGIAYFRRPGHIALLIGASTVTYGVGGLVYWLLRRDHTVCPSCGFLWDEVGRLPANAGVAPVLEERLPSSGSKRRTLGVILLAIA